MTPDPLPYARALPEELTIYTVAELAGQFQRWLAPEAAEAASPDPALCRVDAAAVREVDSAGLQLLAALANSLSAQGQALSLDRPSEPLRRAAGLLGMAHWFDAAHAPREVA